MLHRNKDYDYLMNRSTVKPYQCSPLRPGYFFHPGWQFIHSLTLCFIVNCLLMFLLYSQYTRHKSFAGGNIDVAVLELWEESLDGSGKSAICLGCSKWWCGRCAPWGRRKGAPMMTCSLVFTLAPRLPGSMSPCDLRQGDPVNKAVVDINRLGVTFTFFFHHCWWE